jgi:hypothetical protein
MLVLERKWLLIRSQFTQAEKDAMNAAYQGETICPRGISVDAEQLSPELKTKLITALAGAK